MIEAEMAANPYTLVFGKEPPQLVSRTPLLDEITASFSGNPPAQQIYLITGVRGSGKTTLLTELSKKLRRERDWIVVELNPERDMLQALAAKLSSENDLANIFKSAKLNPSIFGLGLEVENAAPITDIETALNKCSKAWPGAAKRYS